MGEEWEERQLLRLLEDWKVMTAEQATAESLARNAIVKLAAENNLYFVCWSGHFGRYLVALKNTGDKDAEIYSAIYESYYDLVGNDVEVFRFDIPMDNMRWQDLLTAAKAYLPTSVQSI